MGVRLSNLHALDDLASSVNAPDRHGQAMLKEFSTPKGTSCPICGSLITIKPGQTTNAALNLHIDSCLNRQWIRDNVEAPETKSAKRQKELPCTNI